MLQSTPARPSVRGQLSATPLPEFLALALEREMHGSVVIKSPTSSKSALYLERGRVTKVRTAEPMEPLGHLLLAKGAIDGSVLDAALLLSRRQNGRLGASLVQMRALAPDVLSSALEEQTARRLAWIAELPAESIFGYYAGVDFLSDRPACAADPLALIWRCVRDAERSHPRQDALLSSIAERPLRLHPAAAPERFKLSPEESAWLEGLRTQPRPLAGCLEDATLAPSRARRLLYALALTRHLDLGREPLESARPPATGAPQSANADTMGPAHDDARIHTSITRPSMPAPAAISHTSVTPPAMAAVMEGAQGRAAHDPAPHTSITRPAIPARRMPVSTRPSTPPAGPQSAAPPLAPAQADAAAQAFHAARAWAARKRFDHARQCIRQACETDPHNVEYLALHAWVRVQQGELSHPGHAAEIMAQLDHAVMKERDSAAVRFYRAQVLKRLGRNDEAYKDFRFVARRQPDHIDAAREVRLYEMRMRNARKQGGMLSRLFLR